MSEITLDWPIYTQDPEGNDVETIYEISVNIISFGSPAIIRMDPDDSCDAESPEVEIDEIYLDSKKIDPKEWEKHGFTKQILGEIEEKAMEKASEAEEDAEMDRGDHDFDVAREDRLFGKDYD